MRQHTISSSHINCVNYYNQSTVSIGWRSIRPDSITKDWASNFCLTPKERLLDLICSLRFEQASTMWRNDGDHSDSVLRFNRRAFTRTSVHLDKWVRAVPNKKEYERLKNAGRTKEIVFTKNHTAGEIRQLLAAHFPTLVGLDLSR